MTIAGLWRYGDWRHVATGCTAQVFQNTQRRVAKFRENRLRDAEKSVVGEKRNNTANI